MNDYMWIAAGVLVWLIAGAVVSGFFGRAVSTMEGADDE